MKEPNTSGPILPNTKMENTERKSTRRRREKTGKGPSTVRVGTKMPPQRDTKKRRKANAKRPAQSRAKTNRDKEKLKEDKGRPSGEPLPENTL
uniref:Uncharacterized protein n=1 Tax=Vombatus ursinus TaxID=29139 RepID=A0A4X2JVE3_VOMUR